MGSPRIKICGIMRREDAECAAEAGAAYIGTILSRGFERSVSADVARGVAAGLTAALVGVMVDPTVDEAVELALATGARVVQLHGQEPPDLVGAIRDRGPWRVWKAVRVRAGRDPAELAEAYDEVADGILFDGWHPTRVGGAGVGFPWAQAVVFRERMRGAGEFVAAGGLNPDNVARLVEALDPDVVDVSSGVETRIGEKDPALIRRFIENARTERTHRS